MQAEDILAIGETSESLVEVVTRHDFSPSGKALNVTVSIGIASTSDDADVNSAGVMLENADKALYIAKRRGKNQVCCWEELQGNKLFLIPDP